MKSTFFALGLIIALVLSCGTPDKQGATSKKDDKQDSAAGSSEANVIREYYSNGKIKIETSAIGNLRQGPTKSYDRQGRLLSVVYYVNNIREGIATNYYAVSGKVNSTLVYKNGIKEGDEIWYYENGQAFRVTPYIQAKIEGIQKFYFEDGKLMAEVPYKAGNVGVGLKEYKKDGTLITDYPTLIIRQKDYLANANKVILNIELSDSYAQVKFYRGKLTDGKYLNDDLLLLATQAGTTQIDFNVPPGGGRINQIVVISANYKTKYGNPLILSKAYSLNAVNNN
jgi:antitoxin component YwqK of YwqJK toxin-antitoxin module